MSVNRVILVGRLGTDPELRYTQGGTARTEFRMATNRRYKNKEGEYVEDTQWHNIVVWGTQGENCEKYLSKGRQVYVEGRIEHREYEDNDGNTRWWTNIVARNVRFLSDGRGAGPPRPNGASAPNGAGDPTYQDSDIPF